MGAAGYMLRGIKEEEEEPDTKAADVRVAAAVGGPSSSSSQGMQGPGGLLPDVAAPKGRRDERREPSSEPRGREAREVVVGEMDFKAMSSDELMEHMEDLSRPEEMLTKDIGFSGAAVAEVVLHAAY